MVEIGIQVHFTTTQGETKKYSVSLLLIKWQQRQSSGTKRTEHKQAGGSSIFMEPAKWTSELSHAKGTLLEGVPLCEEKLQSHLCPSMAGTKQKAMRYMGQRFSRLQLLTCSVLAIREFQDSQLWHFSWVPRSSDFNDNWRLPATENKAPY